MPQYSYEKIPIVHEPELHTAIEALIAGLATPGSDAFLCDESGRIVHARSDGEPGRIPARVDRVGRTWGDLAAEGDPLALAVRAHWSDPERRDRPSTIRVPAEDSSEPSPILVDWIPLRDGERAPTHFLASVRPPDARPARTPQSTPDTVDRGGTDSVDSGMAVLRDEIALLRSIVAGLDDAVFAKDLDGRYILANAACSRLFERPIEDILGRGDADLHDPELARLTVERDRRILAGEPTEPYEVVDRRSAAGEQRFLVAKWAHRGPDGRPIGLVGIARNVTEARRQEKALRESEAQYRFLAENSTDMISRHDAEGNYLYVSPACRQVVGYEPDDLLGHNAYEFIHPEDIPEVRRLHQHLLESPDTIPIVFRIRRRDGSHCWVETTSRTVRDAKTNAILEIHCSTRDISDRRRAEEELRASRALLRAVLDHSTAVIYAKDLDGRYILMNRWFERVFGLTQEQLLGRTDHEIFPEAIADAFQANDRKVLELGRPIEFEEIAPGKDEPRIYISIKCPILDESGVPKAVCGISTDITERKRFEEQLRLKNARLEQAVRSERRAHDALKRAETQLVQAEKLSSLGQMVAGVAHEINNPLAYVINNVAVLKRDLKLLADLIALYRESDETLSRVDPALAGRLAEMADEIDLNYTLGNLDDLTERSAEGLGRIRQIVRDLRDFARPGEDGLHVADLNAGIASTVNIVHGPATERGIELVAELEPLPRVVCHSGRINQVLLNLLLNALDACSPGDRVTVRSRSEPGAVAIEVIDTGRGIDPAIRHRIFDPFFTTKPIGKGTGLGLSISYGIIRAHGGRIDVESEPGRGSRFIIHLPLEPPQAPPRENEAARSDEARAGTDAQE